AEAERADPPIDVPMPEHLVAVQLVQPPPEPLDQLDLVRADLPQPLFLYVLDARREAGDTENVGGAAFEKVGKLGRLHFAGRIAAGAALAPGPHLRPRTHVQRARAGRPQERLMARKRQ